MPNPAGATPQESTGPTAHADILVIGNGMVGHRFVEKAVTAGLADRGSIVVLGEEPRRAYDRVHLSSVFDGATDDELTLGPPDCYDRRGLDLVLGDAAIALDPEGRAVTTASGRRITCRRTGRPPSCGSW